MNKNLVPSPYTQLIAFELLLLKSEICSDTAQTTELFYSLLYRFTVDGNEEISRC